MYYEVRRRRVRMRGLSPAFRKPVNLFDMRRGRYVRAIREVVERQINSIAGELRPRYGVGFLFWMLTIQSRPAESTIKSNAARLESESAQAPY
jgi:hypothetical protein